MVLLLCCFGQMVLFLLLFLLGITSEWRNVLGIFCLQEFVVWLKAAAVVAVVVIVVYYIGYIILL